MAREEYIRIYRSDVGGATPSLTSGEIATNLVDGKFFIGGTNGSLITFTSNIGVTGIGFDDTDVGLTGKINLTAGSNITITQSGNLITIGGIAQQTTAVTGDGAAIIGRDNAFVTARLVTAAGVTGVASFRNTHFLVDATGHVQLAAAYQATGDIVQAGTFINIGAGKTINNIGVQTFNGLTGSVSLTGDGGAVQGKGGAFITARVGAYGATGVASFDPRFFVVGSSGHVVLTGSYQVTGDTVQAGSGISIGTDKTITNIGVTGIGFGADTGLTGKINLTAGNGMNLTRSGNTLSYSVKNFEFVDSVNIASTSIIGSGQFTITGGTGIHTRMSDSKDSISIYSNFATTDTTAGIAWFRDDQFIVRSSDARVGLAAAYQATGDTVQAGTFINIGTGKTINNIGVQTFNGVTGAVSLTGDGGAVQGKLNNIVTARLADSSVTGVASFNATRFSVSAAGAVDLASAYQATGDTIQAGSAINIGAGKVINNIGVTGIGFDYTDVGLTGKVNITAGSNITITRSGNMITIAGQAQQTTAVTGDGAAIIGRDNAFVTARLVTAAGVTGVASFRNTHFLVDATGHVQLATAYQVTGDTVQAGSGIAIGTNKTITNIGVTGIGLGPNDVGLTGKINLTAGDGMYLTRSGNTLAYSVKNFNFVDSINIASTNVIGIGLFTITGGTGIYTRMSDSKDTLSIYSQFATTDTTAGIAWFRDEQFIVSSGGRVGLAAAYQVTGDTVQAGSAINIGAGKTINNIGVTGIGFDVGDVGLTGKVNITAGSNITITKSGNTITIAGQAQQTTAVTGDGAAIIGRENAFVTARLATNTGVTGVASFNATRFAVSNGAVDLAAAYQATGDIVQAGSFINIGAGKTINNIGVQTFNGVTGAVSLTGDGGAVQGKLNNIVTARLADSSVTGVASFNSTRFTVSAAGAVDLAAAYQATGDTVITVAGSGIGISTSGKTDTLFNIGVTGIGFGADVGLTGKINLTAGTGITITRSGNTITFNGSVATAVTGDFGAIQGKLNTTITARSTTSVIVTNNGIPLGAPGAGTSLASYSGYGEGSNVHGETGVGYFDVDHFVVKPQYGLVQLRNPAFAANTPKFTGLSATGPSDGSLSYMYFDIGNLTFNDATAIDPADDFILFYDSSETGLVKTKRIRSDKILLDNDGVFNSKTSQLVKSKSVSKIEFEITLGAVAAGDEGLVKGASAFSYITQNTVKSINGATGNVMVVGNINGCTGAIVITGTTNEVMVTNSCPNITIGLPDNVSIPYLSGTGATFTQTVTATRFIGIVSGGDF